MNVARRAAQLICELSGAKIVGEPQEFCAGEFKLAEVDLEYARMFSLMGKNIGVQTVKDILSYLDYKILSESENGCRVAVPAYYVDVTRECDVVEEVLRIYGYNNIELPGGMKENHMDFWILDRLLTKDEVKFMLSFKKRRVGYTTAELAERNHMSVEDTQKVIDHLIWIGILEQNRDNADQHIQYWVPKWVVGSGEYMVEHKTLPDEHPEVATMFNLAPQEPLEFAAKLVPPGGAGIGMHVIPVEKAIEHESKSVSVEHLSHWLKKYDKFCVDVCSCRRQSLSVTICVGSWKPVDSPRRRQTNMCSMNSMTRQRP